MDIFKRIVGVAFILFAILFLAIGLVSKGGDGISQSILESPEASGRLLGTMIPVVFFGAIGLWLTLSKKQKNGS